MAVTSPGRERRNSVGASVPVRLRSDLAEMVGWVSRVEGRSATAILDETLRPAIAAKYTALAPAIRAIKAVVGAKRAK